ncbi:hypothetical protein Tco_0979345 [Tanacetum coccineum]
MNKLSFGLFVKPIAKIQVPTSKPDPLRPNLGVLQVVSRAKVPETPASDEELEAPMEDQPLPVDASPTALSAGYIADFNSEEDEEDPADHPADGGDNDDNESSNDDDDDDDDTLHYVRSLSVMNFLGMKLHIHFVSYDLQEMMTTVNQGMSVEEIERVVAQRVANVIEAIATKTNIARKSMIPD